MNKLLKILLIIILNLTCFSYFTQAKHSAVDFEINTQLKSLDKGFKNQKVGYITITSTNPNGFKLAFSDSNNGKLLRKYGDINNEYDYTLFTLSLVSSESEGPIFKPDKDLINIQLTTTPYEINFNDQYRSGSKESYKVKISCMPKSLFYGKYQDTIFLVLTDL